MELNSREIEYLSDVEKRRQKRKIAAWIGLVINAALFIASSSFEWFGGDVAIVFGIFLGVAISTLANEHFGVRAEDKLLNLLQRYVNNDPEAIRQMAEAVSRRGHAA